MGQTQKISRPKLSSTREKTMPLHSAWKDEKIYFDGGDYFNHLLKAIHQAKQSVEVEVYIFEPGWLGDQVITALVKAAARGIPVRVLVDGVGSPDFIAHYGPRLKNSGVQFRVYRSWPVLLSSLLKIFRWQSPILILRKLRFLLNGENHRDHRKLFIIDGKRIWTGSFNISDWHLQKQKKALTWRDTGIQLSQVTNPVFRVAFEIAWEDPWPFWHRWKHHQWLQHWASQDLFKSPIRLTMTRQMRLLYRRELLARFQTAQKRIWIITPYFVPTKSLLAALARASKRGCDVRLILPGPSDIPMVQWVSMTFYSKLLKAGCHLFQYQKSVLHAKTLMVDAWALVGSSNLDHRSLKRDLEINVEPQNIKSKKSLESQFNRDLFASKKMTLTDMNRQPLSIRFLSWLFFRFRFWF